MLLKLLVSNNMDGILEAVRVFGNLSQDRDVCDFIVQNNGELMTLEFINIHFLPVISGVVLELESLQCCTCFCFEICRAPCLRLLAQDAKMDLGSVPVSLVNGLLCTRMGCVYV